MGVEEANAVSAEIRRTQARNLQKVQETDGFDWDGDYWNWD